MHMNVALILVLIAVQVGSASADEAASERVYAHEEAMQQLS